MSDEIPQNKQELSSQQAQEASDNVPSEIKKSPASNLNGPLILILIAILGAGFLLRTQHLTKISFCFDEACSWRISQFPIHERLDANSRDAHPPLYYFVLNGWMAVFGNGVIAARSLSILFGLLTILAAWWFTRIAIGQLQCETEFHKKGLDYEIVPILAAALVAISPLQVEMSLFARPYTLGTFLAVMGGIFLLHVIRNPSKVTNWVGFTLATAAVSLTHYFGLWTLAAFVLYIILEAIFSLVRNGWVTRTKHLVIGVVLSVWAMQMIWLPWFSTFLFQRSRIAHQRLMPPISFSGFNNILWKVLASGNYSEVWPDYAWITSIFFLLVGIGLLISRTSARRLTAIAFLFPPLAVVGYGFLAHNTIGVRYLIFAHVFFLIGIAIIFGRGKLPYLRYACLLLVFSWSGFWAYQYSSHRDFLASFPGSQSAIAYINENRDPSEPVVFGSPFVLVIAHQYIDQADSIYTKHYGDHRSNIFSGPAIKLSDYQGVPDLLESRPRTLWIVDVIGLFGGIHAVDVPEEYVLISEERFPERFAFRMDLVVKKYQLK